MRFWVVFRSERAVSTTFPPYIMPNGTYERIKKIYDTLPLSVVLLSSAASCHLTMLFQFVNLTSTTGCPLTLWCPGFCYKLSFSSPHTHLSLPLSLSLPTHPFSLSPSCETPTPCHCLTLHPLTYGQCIILCKYSITIDTCCMHIL